MPKERLNDYLEVIHMYDLINNMYDRLTYLEINNQFNNLEFKSILKLIIKYKKKSQNILKKYSIYDLDMEEFVGLLEEINKIDRSDFIEFVTYPDNIKQKKFINTIYEMLLDTKDFDDEELLQDHNTNVVLCGEEYDIFEAIELLEEANQDETASKINNIVNNAKEQKYNELLNYYKLCKIRATLINHTIMDYLLEAIKLEKNKTVKEFLIKFKYKMIGIFENLENPFVISPDDFSLTSLYQKELSDNYKGNEEQIYNWNMDSRNVINNILDDITNRKQTKLNINELIEEKLDLIVLKAHSSLINNQEILQDVIDDKKVALELSDNPININFIKKSLKLEKQNMFLGGVNNGI